jgi:CMP-2-keto-3-deoxyoctulosonic acid synthetase
MIIVVIPAKGASARLPNKNMTPINGRPMIDYAIDDALASRRAAAVYVSTDSDAIAAHAATRGLPVIRRPVSLGGETPIIEVYRHAIANMPEGEKVTVVVGLQPDHPDRDVGVDASIAEFERAGADMLNSTDAGGAKNGAHYVLSRHFVETGQARHTITIVDNCTNIHFPDDLERASRRLAVSRRAAQP